jgi:hypothetical protein
VLELEAPPGIRFEYPPPAPEPPDPPKRPDEPVFPAAWQLPTLPILAPRKSELPAWLPRLRVETRWVRANVSEPLRPDYRTFAGKVWIALEPGYPDTDIRIPYVLYAAAGGKPQSGELVVAISHRHEPWQLPGLPSYLSPRLSRSRRETQFDRYVRELPGS